MKKRFHKFKNIRKLLIAIVCVLALSISIPTSFGTQTGLVTTAQAAARISSTKKTLAVGQTSRLKVSGVAYSAKVRWSSSNRKIVRVSNNGKIRAMKPGTAKIKAKVGGRTLICKVTVKKNILKLRSDATPRTTGFYDVGQSGNLLSSINIRPVWIKYTASGALKIKFQLYNFSDVNWSNIQKFRGVYIRTYKGDVLVDRDPVESSNGFTLDAGETKYLTFTFSGKAVKKVVNLNKAGGISYAIDIYANDAWYD